MQDFASKKDFFMHIDYFLTRNIEIHLSFHKKTSRIQIHNLKIQKLFLRM